MSPTSAPEYTPYYCEENVWRLLARPEFAAERAFAVLVSNPSRRVAMLRQRAGKGDSAFVEWDYQVFAAVTAAVAVAGGEGRAFIFDLDTLLGFPCPLDSYLAGSFPEGAPPILEPRFLVLRADRYVADLVSDRSHMRAADGSYLAPPPPWPAPGAGSGRSNVLMAWIEEAASSPIRALDARVLAL
ncbi:MAG: hypothetical protein Q8M76_10410 [Spirochaetaceae bacterium]|nr:hypothetical protein [Spirochaetaceae bacterium]